MTSCPGGNIKGILKVKLRFSPGSTLVLLAPTICCDADLFSGGDGGVAD